MATVAGIAALWLAKHGRDTIIQVCGGEEKIAPTFMQLLRSTATPEPHWPVGQFGGGLVAADKLLGEPLPDGAVTPTLAPTSEENVAINRGGSATFAHLFEATVRADAVGSQPRAADTPVNPYDRLSARLADLLNTSQDKLPVDLGQIGQELAFYLATDPGLHRRFTNTVTPVLTRARGDAGQQAEGTSDFNGRLQDVRERLLAKVSARALAAKLEK